MQVQVGVVGGAVGDGGGVYVDDAVIVGCDPSLGDVDASAECEANATVKLVAASAMLASPAIFARFVSFNAVTRFLLAAGKSGARTVGAQAGRSACHRAANALASHLGNTRGQCYRMLSMLRVEPLRGYRIVTIRRAALTLDRWA
jgi:hypothetical protein